MPGLRVAKVLAKESRLSKALHKTQLCQHFQTGKCTFGARCRFAHDESELRSRPTFSCTKLCPSVAAGQPCNDPACTFAHSTSELRAFDDDLSPRSRQESAPTPSMPPARFLPQKTSALPAWLAPSTPEPESAAVPLPLASEAPMYVQVQQPALQLAPLAEVESSRQPVVAAEADAEAPMRIPMSKTKVRTHTLQARVLAKESRLSKALHKTQLCLHAQSGKCTFGAMCRFAHDVSELRSKPTMSRTKPCPALCTDGVCSDPACTYAHDVSELRPFDDPPPSPKGPVAALYTRTKISDLSETLAAAAPMYVEMGERAASPPATLISAISGQSEKQPRAGHDDGWRPESSSSASSHLPETFPTPGPSAPMYVEVPF